MTESNYAFPSPDNYDAGGLLKVEYFAAKAMQGILANPISDNMTPNRVAQLAVTQAISLLDELNKIE